MPNKNRVPVIPVSSEDDEILVKLDGEFEKLYGLKPDCYVSVPGRVNLIGEHIDYCGYSVCPMALRQRILIAVKPSSNGILKLANLDSKYPYYEGSIQSLSIQFEQGTSPPWHDYVFCGIKGVLEKVENKQNFHGLLAVVWGDIPPNSGLSSSSALVSAAATALVTVNQLELSMETLATLCAHCEHYIGTQGGGMDQAIAFLGTSGCAKHIEFNPLRTTDVELPKGVSIVIAHSLVELNKAASIHFNQRVVECRIAVQILLKLEGVVDWSSHQRLSDVPVVLGIKLAEMAEKVRYLLHDKEYSKQEICEVLGVTEDELDQNVLTENTRHLTHFKLRQRALHVYEEAQRVALFCSECEGRKRVAVLGELINASHQSLSELYECSHPQLDELVKTAREAGAVGARLTGAGWGGCVVTLVPEEHVNQFIASVKKNFYEKENRSSGRNLDSLIFSTAPCSGAAILQRL